MLPTGPVPMSAWAVIPAFGLANARVGLRTDDGLVDVSGNVTIVHSALAVSPNEVVIMFVRDSSYHAVRLDARSLRTLSDRELQIPALDQGASPATQPNGGK